MEPNPSLLSFIKSVEDNHFRTDTDTGANLNALFIWNRIREYAGLEPLRLEDLPSYCKVCDNYHVYPCLDIV